MLWKEFMYAFHFVLEQQSRGGECFSKLLDVEVERSFEATHCQPRGRQAGRQVSGQAGGQTTSSLTVVVLRNLQRKLLSH